MVNPVEGWSAEEKILEAARHVFFRHGYAGARMQDIADEAGINKALLHYYFRSKEKLFDVIFQEAFGRFIPKVSEIIASDLPFFEKITSFIHAYISMATEHPFIPMFVLNEIHTDPEGFKGRFGVYSQKLPLQRFKTDINKAVAEGLIHPIDPVQLVINIISLCLFPFIARPMIGMVMQLSDTQLQKLSERRKSDVAEFVIRAIKK